MSRHVVSLVPSVTETLLAWGVTPVAVTRFCDAPGVPTVGGTKNPGRGRHRGAPPDLVVMDKEENRADDADALQASGVLVHVTHVRAVEDVAPTLARLAAAVGVAGPGRTPISPVSPASGRLARLGADLAAALDDDQRRHLRLHPAAGGRDPQRLRGRRRSRTRQSPWRRPPLHPTWCWPHPSRTPSPSATGPSSSGGAGGLRRRPGPVLVGQPDAGGPGPAAAAGGDPGRPVNGQCRRDSHRTTKGGAR